MRDLDELPLPHELEDIHETIQKILDLFEKTATTIETLDSRIADLEGKVKDLNDFIGKTRDTPKAPWMMG